MIKPIKHKTVKNNIIILILQRHYYLCIACSALIIYISTLLLRTVDYVSLPRSINVPSLLLEPDRTPRQTDIQFDAIAKKWGLSESAIPLLEMQTEKRIDYDSTTDILAFYHSLKTGGTSLSIVLRDLFPGGKIPGSHPSKYFNKKIFKRNLKEKSINFWNRQRVMYSHSSLRVHQSGTSGGLLSYLREKVYPLAKKNYRLLTLIRDPIAWRASSFYETLCRVGSWIEERQQILGNSSECPPVNLTDVAKARFEKAIRGCKKKKGGEKCKAIRPTDFKHCRSIDALFQSGKLDNMYENAFMGLLPQPPSKENSLTPTYEDVELYTLRDLGGLVKVNETHGEDYIWFGITERMQESMCIFYYNLKLDPLPMPHNRFKPCRPISFWEEEHFQWVHEHEKFDYAVWRAGNAILDVRVEVMKLDIQARIDAGESLDSIRYLAPGCFSENDLLHPED